MPDNRTNSPHAARCTSVARRRSLSAAAALAALMFLVPSAHAGDCPSDQAFFKVPEIVAHNGILRGTLQLTDTQVWMRNRFPPQGQTNAVPPGTKGAIYNCFAQNVRAFRIFPDHPLPAVAGQTVPDPFPGPTLRARVGDIVELTFINQLDAARFGRTGNRRCDVVNSVYPGPDRFPDCFHGSSTGNIHFHGTHTNPNGTADNVLLEVAASPRDANNKPTITADTYKKEFDAFFEECEKHLRGNQLAEWPRNWNGSDDPGGSSLGPWQKPGTWTATQLTLLGAREKAADEDVASKKPVPGWPQYYVGAYPYCFHLPIYTSSSFPPPPGTLQMGQAPGTHWYHAHKHGSTAIDVANGMVGAFIIEGPSYDDYLNTFYGPGWTRTQPVMVINQTGVAPNMMRAAGPARQDKGPDLVVNGRFASIIDIAPGEVQMWRIVNGSGRSGVFINGAASFVDASNAPAGFRYRRIAQDGVQLADNNYQSGENKPLLLASGNRADLLVMAPKTPGLYQMMVQHEVDPSDLSSAIPVVLLQIRVNNNLPPVTGHRSEFIPAMPKPSERDFPAFLTNITAQEANTPRTAPPRCISVDRASSSPCGTANNPRLVVFSTEPPVGPTPPPTPSPGSQHLIDGQQFNENPDDAKTVTLDTVEEWQVENTSIDPNIGPVSHPFHIHVNPFQLVEIFDPNQTVVVNGQPAPKYVTTTPADASVQCQIDPTDRRTWVDCHNTLADDTVPRIWWDVFPIPSANQSIIVKVAGYFGPLPGHFRMRSRFVDFPGEYVIHCHILAHEDRGMMALVELKAPSAPSMLGMFHHH